MTRPARRAFEMRTLPLTLTLLWLVPAAQAEPVLLAAASTSRVVDAVIAASAIGALASYGALGTVARQIERGTPADLHISALSNLVTAINASGKLGVSPGVLPVGVFITPPKFMAGCCSARHRSSVSAFRASMPACDCAANWPGLLD